MARYIYSCITGANYGGGGGDIERGVREFCLFPFPSFHAGRSHVALRARYLLLGGVGGGS